MDAKLKDFSDVDLLRELVRRNGAQPGPSSVKYFVPTKTTIVGIGRDHCADIVFSADAFQSLEDLSVNLPTIEHLRGVAKSRGVMIGHAEFNGNGLAFNYFIPSRDKYGEMTAGPNTAHGILDQILSD